MVVVTQNPFSEGEPMLDTSSSEDGSRAKSFNHFACSMINDLNFDSFATDSPDAILQLFSTGVQLHNGPLVKKCIEKLDEILNADNVLKIYPYLPDCHNYDPQPSAPPPESPDELTMDWVQNLTKDLRHNCLIIIDRCGDHVLKQNEMLNLCYRDINDIVERDSLSISSELIVYNTIYCWGLAELERLEMESNRLRDILRELPYRPRYGLLSKKEFDAWTVRGFQNVPGPTRSKLLSEKDVNFIKFHIKERSKGRIAQELPHKMSQSRGGVGEKPKILSTRSATQSESEFTPTPQNSNPRQCYKTVNSWEKCFMNFLTCWTAVFD